MKLALVLPGPLDRRSGGYSYDVDLVVALQSAGHAVEVWDITREPLRLDAGSADVLIFDALVHPLVVEQLSDGLRRVANEAGTKALWLGLVHHLAWLEDPEPTAETPAKRELERRFLELMDGYLFNSEDTRRSVAELRGAGARFMPSQLCLPPLPPPSVDPAPLASSLQTAATLRLFFLANITPRKNLPGLLMALALLSARRPELDWSLVIAGSETFDPEHARSCRELALRPGLKGRVRWTGRLEGSELAAQWAQTDVLAVPSFHEGWGMVYAEALVRGVIPLAANRGGGAEAVGNAGLLVEPGSPESIAAALESLSDPGLRQRLHQRALRRGQVLAATTGFAGLDGFVRSLAAEVQPSVLRALPPPFDFGAYLDAKAELDTRSLNPRVQAAAWKNLVLTPGNAGLTVLELGAGTGTMAVRLLDSAALIAGSVEKYTLVDERAEGLEVARGRLQPRLGQAFRTETADVYDYLAAHQKPAGKGPEVLIALAFLDLFDPSTLAPLLAGTGAKRYWLTHLFDGLTAWEPRLDAELDEALVRAYHVSMDERTAHGGEGSSRSGRDWLTALPVAGLTILEAGSSDWLVYPRAPREGAPGAVAAYTANERTFLLSLLHFFRTSLTDRADVDQKGLAWWLARRQEQVARGEVILLAHQLDIAASGLYL